MADRIVTTHRTPNWDKWRLIPEPRLWQCIALSLNIDPDSIEIDPVFGRDPILPRRPREFGDRIDIARENLHRTLRCTAVAMDRPLQSRVSLREFAVWVRQLGWTAPAELLAMADQRPQNINWDYWGALDLWPLDAACKLISGDNPNEPTRREDIENSDIVNRPEWVNVYYQAMSAIKAGNLRVVNGEVTPAEFIAWVQGKGIQIRRELVPMAPATDQTAAESGSTSRRTHNKRKTEARNRAWQQGIDELATKHPGTTHTELCRKLAPTGVKWQTIRRKTKLGHS